MEQILLELKRNKDANDIHEIYIKYKKDLADNYLIELEHKFFEDDKYEEYMSLYLEKQMRNNGYDKKKYNEEGKYERKKNN